jgi:signal transduction histidine kinase
MESIESVREISANLHPRQIERLGFCTAVNTMVDKLSHSSAMDIQCRCDQVDDAMTKEAKIHVYRIIQESLTNIVKHSEATVVILEIRKNQNNIEITIEDNGKGFDTERLSSQLGWGRVIDVARGFGVASMTERARIVGGTLTINSQAQKGTTVHLALPLWKG